MKQILIIIVLLLISSCSNPERAISALKSAGYKDIRLHGKSIFACGHGDIYSDEFSAINPNGTFVQGVVCSGLFKRSTIRF